MFADLVALFSGWYSDFLDAVSQILVTEVVLNGSDEVLSSTSRSIDVWSAYVPWEHLIATVVLIVFLCAIFKLLRTVLCKIL